MTSATGIKGLITMALAALLLWFAPAWAYDFGSVPDPCSGGCGCVNCDKTYNFRFQDTGRPHRITVPETTPPRPKRSPARNQRAKEHERQVRAAVAALQRELIRVTLTQGGQAKAPRAEVSAWVGDRLLMGRGSRDPDRVTLSVPLACTPGTRQPGCGLGAAAGRMRQGLSRAGAEDLRRALAVITPALSTSSKISDEDRRFLAEQAALAMQGLPVRLVVPTGAARPDNQKTESLRQAMDGLLEGQQRLSRIARLRVDLEGRLEELTGRIKQEKDKLNKKQLEAEMERLDRDLARVTMREEEQRGELSRQVERVRYVVLSGK